MTQVKVVIEKKSRRRWAAYGFVLIVALMIISWFLSPSIIQMLRTNSDFRAGMREMPDWQVQVAFTLVIFVILASLSALIVTIAAPKRALEIKDKDLIKEREEAIDYNRKARKRQRELNREMREHVQKNQK
jgi:membrane protein implicated in regulation of membrane protease activity